MVAEGVNFSLSEARLGLLPATISPYVVRAMGEQAARRYFVTAERFGAAEAKAMGFAHEVTTADALDTKVEELVAALVANGPMATRACKKLVQDVAGREITPELRAETARRIADIRASAEGKEGVPSFLEKRKPAWLAPTLAADAAALPPGGGGRLGAARRRAGLAAVNLDFTQLVAIAAALGWASGLRLYAVVFLTGAAGARLDRPAGRSAHPAEPVAARRQRRALVRRVLRRQDSRPRQRLGRAPHRDPDSRRRGAGGRRLRQRRSHLDDGRGAAGGGLAATSHLAKATTRAAANTSPEPFSNIALSLLGDGLLPFVPLAVVGTSGAALHYPRRGLAGDAGDDLGSGAISAPRCQRRGPALSSADASRSPQRGDPMSALPSTVTLVDVGPRDGLQNEKQAVEAAVKVELVHRLQAAGLKEIEVTSFVSPKWVPQMGDNATVMAGIVRKPGVRYSVLVPNMKGLDAALSAPRDQWPDEVVVFAAASEAFSRRTSTARSPKRRALPAGGRRRRGQGIKVRGAVSVALGCPYQGEVSADEVEHVVRLMKEVGVDHCGLADTIGVGTPKTVQAAMERALRHFPIEEVSGHFHDTYAQAVGNVYAALEVGITTFDASIAGLGGCPYAKGATGNVATEDVLFMFQGLGIETGISLDGLVDAAAYISGVLGRKPVSRSANALLAKRASAAEKAAADCA